jgi:hypothetical protein
VLITVKERVPAATNCTVTGSLEAFVTVTGPRPTAKLRLVPLYERERTESTVQKIAPTITATATVTFQLIFILYSPFRYYLTLHVEKMDANEAITCIERTGKRLSGSLLYQEQGRILADLWIPLPPDAEFGFVE